VCVKISYIHTFLIRTYISFLSLLRDVVKLRETHAPTHVYADTYLYVIHTHIYIYTYIYVDICNVHVYTYMHIYTCIYIYAYIYMYTWRMHYCRATYKCKKHIKKNNKQCQALFLPYLTALINMCEIERNVKCREMYIFKK